MSDSRTSGHQDINCSDLIVLVFVCVSLISDSGRCVLVQNDRSVRKLATHALRSRGGSDETTGKWMFDVCLCMSSSSLFSIYWFSRSRDSSHRPFPCVPRHTMSSASPSLVRSREESDRRSNVSRHPHTRRRPGKERLV